MYRIRMYANAIQGKPVNSAHLPTRPIPTRPSSGANSAHTQFWLLTNSFSFGTVWPTRFPSCVSYFRDRLYLKNNLFTVWVITTHNIDGISMPTALCFELTMQFTVIAREQWMMTHQHEWVIRWLRKRTRILPKCRRMKKNNLI